MYMPNRRWKNEDELFGFEERNKKGGIGNG
jgi:hypothetical protein